MSNQHPVITMPSGEAFELVDFAAPEDRDIYLTNGACVSCSDGKQINRKHILKPIPTPEPSDGAIERKGRWGLYREDGPEVAIDANLPIDALADALNCQTAGDLNVPDLHTALNKLREFLAANNITQPVRKERYYAQHLAVVERLGEDGGIEQVKTIGIAKTPEDAASLAAALNSATPGDQA